MKRTRIIVKSLVLLLFVCLFRPTYTLEMQDWEDILVDVTKDIDERVNCLLDSVGNDFFQETDDSDETLLSWLFKQAVSREAAAKSENNDSCHEAIHYPYRAITLACVKKFLERNEAVAIVQWRDPQENTLLHLVACLGDASLIEKIALPDLINVVNEDGHTALMTAAHSPFATPEALSTLLKRGVDVNMVAHVNDNTVGEPCTALLYVLEGGSLEALEVIIDAQPSFFYQFGIGPKKSVFNWMLEENGKNNSEENSAQFSVIWRYFTTLPLSQQQEAIGLLDNNLKGALLQLARSSSAFGFIEHLLEQKIMLPEDIRACDPTMFHDAALDGQHDLFRIVEVYPSIIDIHAMNNHKTPLFLLLDAACEEGNKTEDAQKAILSSLKIILAADDHDHKEKSVIAASLGLALHFSVCRLSASFVIELIRHIAKKPLDVQQDVLSTARGSKPRSILWTAVSRGDAAILDALFTSFHPSCFNLHEIVDGHSLLHSAVIARRESAIKYLLENGDFSQSSPPAMLLELLMYQDFQKYSREDVDCDYRIACSFLKNYDLTSSVQGISSSLLSCSLLHYACQRKRSGIVAAFIDELVERRASSTLVKSVLMAKNAPHKLTPLEYAMYFGDVASFALLLETRLYDDEVFNIAVYCIRPSLQNEDYLILRLIEDFYAFYPLIDLKSYDNEVQHQVDEFFCDLVNRSRKDLFEALSKNMQVKKVKKALNLKFPDDDYGQSLIAKAVHAQSCFALEALLKHDQTAKNELNQLMYSTSGDKNTPLSFALLQLKNDLSAQDCLRRYGVCVGPARMIFLLLSAGASLECTTVMKLFGEDQALAQLVLDLILPLVDEKRRSDERRAANLMHSTQEDWLMPQKKTCQDKAQEDKKLREQEKKQKKKKNKQNAFPLPAQEEMDQKVTEDLELCADDNKANALYSPQVLPLQVLAKTAEKKACVDLAVITTPLQDLSLENKKSSPEGKNNSSDGFPELLNYSKSFKSIAVDTSIPYAEAPQEPVTIRMLVTPTKLSTLERTIGTDFVKQGPLINFNEGDISAYLEELVDIDAKEEKSNRLQGKSKNELTRDGVVKLHKRVLDKMAWRIRASASENLDESLLDHSLTTEFLIEVLRHGSTYLQLSVPEPGDEEHGLGFRLLIVASVNETSSGRVAVKAAAGTRFATLAFSLDDEGRAFECVHCCIHKNHPVYSLVEQSIVGFPAGVPKRLLAPLAVKVGIVSDSSKLFFQCMNSVDFQAKKNYLNEMTSLLQSGEINQFWNQYHINQKV